MWYSTQFTFFSEIIFDVCVTKMCVCVCVCVCVCFLNPCVMFESVGPRLLYIENVFHRPEHHTRVN